MGARAHGAWSQRRQALTCYSSLLMQAQKESWQPLEGRLDTPRMGAGGGEGASFLPPLLPPPPPWLNPPAFPDGTVGGLIRKPQTVTAWWPVLGTCFKASINPSVGLTSCLPSWEGEMRLCQYPRDARGKIKVHQGPTTCQGFR